MRPLLKLQSVATIFLCFNALTGGASLGEVLEIEASKDNTLYQIDAGNLSNGIGEHMFAGRSGQSDDLSRRRALIAFDVAAAVPSGSVINEATLTLRMSRTQAGIRNVALHRLLSDWGEGDSQGSGQEGAGGPAQAGDATWLHRFYPTILWSVPGGNYFGTPSGTTAIGGNGFYNWNSLQVISLRVNEQISSLILSSMPQERNCCWSTMPLHPIQGNREPE